MFVKNGTRLEAALARADYGDVAVAALVVEASYRVEGRSLHLIAERLDRLPTDPPNILREPLWPEVAVTVAGSVLGPSQAPFHRDVALRVGAEERRLAVSGERLWVRGTGGLRPTDPVRFDSIPLSFSRAFGGKITVEPGLDPVNGLPHPGGEVPYPLNPEGVGFYADERSAVDRRLPCIEDPLRRVERWDDRPEPAGFSPCPDLVALRMPRLPLPPGAVPTREQMTRIQEVFNKSASAIVLRMRSHAPPALIFPEVPPGTPVRLDGVGRRPVRFALPASPVTVARWRGRDRSEIDARLRAIHVDADREIVTTVYAHAFRHPPASPPDWLHVARAA